MRKFQGLAEFIAVIETGSFSSAARRMGTSVAHISRHVTALEKRLGNRLFVRTTRRVKPTAAGQDLALTCMPLLNELERIQDDMLMKAEALAGTIRLSMGDRFAEQQVAPELARFCAAHPGIRIDVDLSGQKVNLFDDSVDFAVRMGSMENSSALVARRLAEMPMTTLAAPALVKRLEDETGSALSPLTVSESRCLSLAGRRWRFRREAQFHVIEPAGPLSSNSSHVLIKAATEGLGLIQVPSLSAREACRTQQLIPVFTDWQAEDSIVFNIVYLRNRFMPSRVRLLIDHLLSCDFSA